MALELGLTPSGHLLLYDVETGGEASAGHATGAENPPGPGGASAPAAMDKKIVKAFASCQAEGLWTLSAGGRGEPLSPSVLYWRDYAARYLTALCRATETPGGAIGPAAAPAGELPALALSAPPMKGGEYLNAETLHAVWTDLDGWARQRIAASGQGLAAWLKRHAPLWHAVGRVCFHLAENKNDPQYPFAFLATYAPSLSAGGRVQYRPLGKALQDYAGARDKPALAKLLAPVRAASGKSAFVKRLADSGDLFHPLAWTPADAYRLLRDAPLLEDSGLLVRLPDWWRRRPRPAVSVTIGDKKRSAFGIDTLLDFDVALSLDGQRLTEDEWRQLMEAGDGLVNLRGQWVEVDRDKLAQALDHWKLVQAHAKHGGLSFAEGMRLLAGAPMELSGDDGDGDAQQWSHVNAGQWLSGILSSLRDPAQLDGADTAGGFEGSLRPYQKTGRDWLRLVTGLGLGACLADDMGLGKTVQAISLLAVIKNENRAPRKPSLLVLPASLLSNWKSELRRFAPRLRTLFVHPSETPKAELDALAAGSERVLSGTDLVLTTYGMLLRQDWLLETPWRLAILDEAQAIKNPGSRQTRAVKRLDAEARIAMTGTPVENRLGDLWSLFDFLCPGLLGSASRFKQFLKSLDRRENGRYAPLRELVRPYILRRLKTDKSVIADLPDKTELKAHCGLTKQQAALYARVVEELAAALDGLDGMKRRGLVLTTLMKLKQICNHPSHYLGDGQYAPDGSGKFHRLRELCDEIASRQEKALVFTQFREMTGPLAEFLAGVFGRQGLTLHGGTPVGKRRQLVEAFQREDGPPFFVLSLKAGGTGLNLTAASHVIHFDRWWNPAVENQATDRAYRIGQRRNVLAHKFVCRGTVEEKIDATLGEKTEMAESVLSGGGAETLLTEMSDAELLSVVSLDIEQAAERD